jgi:hypothetical protein
MSSPILSLAAEWTLWQLVTAKEGHRIVPSVVRALGSRVCDAVGGKEGQ